MRYMTRNFTALVVGFALTSLTATPSVALKSGDVPAPVDFRDDGGPGQSHTNGSGVSGFDGNQGNDKRVGNAGGGPHSDDPVDNGDGEDSEEPSVVE